MNQRDFYQLVRPLLNVLANIEIELAHGKAREAMRKVNRPRCGAWARSRGRSCEAPVWRRDDGSLANRCRMHGGLSTGPKTPEGKARSAENWRRRWAR